MEQVYDSSLRRAPAVLVRGGWAHRHLVAVLARREIHARYQRSLIGVGWALLTPLAYAAALYAVFSGVGRFATPGVPYVTYVVSGVIVLTFATQTILGAAGAVVTNRVAQRRFHVPVGVFVAASVASSLVALAVSCVGLVVVVLTAGPALPATVLLLPFAGLLLAVAAGGVGLFVGSLAALFVDAMEGTRVGLTLVGFLTPVFYPVAVVPHAIRWLAADNPLSRFVELFRELAYGGRLPGVATLSVCAGSALVASAIGSAAFVWIRRAVPSLL